MIVVFRLESADPFGALVDVGERCISMIGGLATKGFERCLHCCCQSDEVVYIETLSEKRSSL